MWPLPSCQPVGPAVLRSLAATSGCFERTRKRRRKFGLLDLDWDSDRAAFVGGTPAAENPSFHDRDTETGRAGCSAARLVELLHAAHLELEVDLCATDGDERDVDHAEQGKAHLEGGLLVRPAFDT